MRLLAWLAGSIVLVALAEYVAHRWLMHRRWRWPRPIERLWLAHAVEHHAKRRIDVNVDLPVWCSLAWGSPVLLGAGWFDLGGAVALGVVATAHALAWTHCHRAIHGLGSDWVRRVPGFAAVERHHVAHHRRPGRNFAVIFLPTDRLFGTQAR